MKRWTVVLFIALLFGGCVLTENQEETIWNLAVVLIPVLAGGLGWLCKKYIWLYRVLKILVAAIEEIEPPDAKVRPVKAEIRVLAVGAGKYEKFDATIDGLK